MTSDPEKPKAKPDFRYVAINLFRHEQLHRLTNAKEIMALKYWQLFF